MIDIAILRENPELFRASQRMRGEDPEEIDRILELDESVREAQTSFERARAEQKADGMLLRRAMPERREGLLATAKEKALAVDVLRDRLNDLREQLTTALLGVANLVEPGVPAGGENDFVVLDSVGQIRDFAAEGFSPKDHFDLGTELGILDMSRGVKVSGSRFYFLRDLGSMLELGLLRLGMDCAMEAGFTPLTPPALVSPRVMAGAGYLDRHSDSVYRLAEDDLYLTGTAEAALAGYHMDEIIDLSSGPKRYVGWSTCFRREAGSYGKDVRGIMRVHQFQKVEMFSYCQDGSASEEHEFLLDLQKKMLSAIEVPFRVIDTAAGDLGDSASRKYDCEAWIPSEGRYREMTSTSNCRTYQARRLKVRERSAGKSKMVATLNGTIATTRWLVAIIENHQQADGSVRIPAALQPYVGTDLVAFPQ